MGKTKITIVGTPIKEPKINADKTVELLFKNNMNEFVPKGLKSLGESIYFVRIGPKAWDKIADNITKDSIYTIQGEPKAAVNKKGLPFTIVICFEISVKEIQNTTALPGEVILKPLPVKPIVNIPEKQYSKIPWYIGLEDQLKVINVDDIILTESVHLTTKMLNIRGLAKAYKIGFIASPIAVKVIDNNKYSLVTGVKNFLHCKLANIKTINAYITDLDYAAFVKKHNLDEYIK